MADKIPVKVSGTPRVSNLSNFIVLGMERSTNNSAHADMEQLRGNTAYQEWAGRNPGSTYNDWLDYLRQPASDAAAGVGRLEAQVARSEASRVEIEQERVTAEGFRAAAEQVREKTEEERVKAENDRVTAEKKRDEAEGMRVEAESGRATAEEHRVENDQSRTQNENIRRSQEDTRQRNTAAAVQDAEKATKRANDAAEISETLNANQPVMQTNDSGILTWRVWNLDTHSYTDTGLPARGAEGKPLKVSTDGYYMYWDETAQDYVTSSVEASVSVDLQNIPVEFTEAETKETINTGESVPTVFGKLKKWFSSFGTLAWKSTVDYDTEVDNKPAIPTKTSNLTNDSDYQTGSNVDTKISTHNQSAAAHADIRERIEAVYNIATGARLGIVFDDTAQFNAWIAGTYEREDGLLPTDLKVGENIYLRALGEIDLWWDGTQAQQQESEKVDLSDYVTLTAGDVRYLPKTDTASDSNKLGGIDSTLYGFMNGSKTVTTLASLALDKQIIYADISANVSLSVASRTVDGQPSHIFVRNTTTTARTITIPTTGSYVSMSGASKTLPASGYLEISIAYDPVISKYRITVLEAE